LAKMGGNAEVHGFRPKAGMTVDFFYISNILFEGGLFNERFEIGRT